MATLPAPLRVSPLIRFSRWSLLLLGVSYGAVRYSVLSKRENALREIEAKQKPIRDAKIAAEKARLAKEEMAILAKEAGVTLEES
ncbi:ATP synthase subunit e, mitochondrial [Bacillus rossius redtenbacheri]|uniref:ATP synthase subunit e, mitochondrial n=1 Tax=Bacillus rossius redtenbacheri TaxID=93214 RepID=UPI002FDEED10